MPNLLLEQLPEIVKEGTSRPSASLKAPKDGDDGVDWHNRLVYGHNLLTMAAMRMPPACADRWT